MPSVLACDGSSWPGFQTTFAYQKGQAQNQFGPLEIKLVYQKRQVLLVDNYYIQEAKSRSSRTVRFRIYIRFLPTLWKDTIRAALANAQVLIVHGV